MTLSKNSKFFPDDLEANMPAQHQTEWVEDVFHLEKKLGRHAPLPETRKHTSTSITGGSLKFLLFIILLFFSIVCFRLIYIQIINSAKFRNLAMHNSQRIVPIPSERGLILDRNGVALTENVPKFSLALIPQNLPRDPVQRTAVVDRLSALTQRSQEDIEAVLKEYGLYQFESIVIQEDISYETALSLYVSLVDLPGISIIKGSKRNYVHSFGSKETSLSLSHILGYEGKLNRAELDSLYQKGYLPSDDIGKIGIEKSYEENLRGDYGRRLVEVDALGRVQQVLSETAPEAGAHVVLSLDVRLQTALEKAVRAHLTKEYSKAAAILSDVRTGGILAFVSLPSYDNNDFSGGITMATYTAYIDNPDQPLFNRAISGSYPSGSTIKPMIAAIGLENGAINKDTTVRSTGGLQIGQWFFPDWQAGGHGVTNVTKALAWSVNTFFYYLVGGFGDKVGMGIDKLVSGLKGFGFGEKFKVDIPGEVSGFVPSPEWKEEAKGEQWYIGDTYNVSIGQGDVLVTPLQINSLTAAIANGGNVYQPHFVDEIKYNTDDTVEKILPNVLRALPVSEYNLSTVRLGMRECVVYGSCRSLAVLPVMIAGKTGTAQWNSNKNNHAWFTSFAPYNNPEVALTILVEEGKEGSAVAVPIAYDFYKEWWRIRSTPVVDTLVDGRRSF